MKFEMNQEQFDNFISNITEWCFSQGEIDAIKDELLKFMVLEK